MVRRTCQRWYRHLVGNHHLASGHALKDEEARQEDELQASNQLRADESLIRIFHYALKDDRHGLNVQCRVSRG